MKIKSWNVTVIDNPNTVTVSENDEFYTTDTEAFLVFDLQDEDFHPTSATITLHNRTDGSIVNEDTSVVNGVIEYEMRREVIKHAGVWRAQVVYEQDKDRVPEKYTSKVVSFGVSGHLLENKEPPLFLVENWNNFILSSESLIEGWKQNEAARKAAERKRDVAEDSRVSEENKRVSAESDRQSNEVVRQANEADRQQEFESNEVDRQANETVRQSQEESRENNESERQMNYNELVDTGIMQENINQKLSESEQTYAPRLTNLEQNDADLTAQLAQTVDDVNRAASELTQDSEVILARGSYDTLGERLEDVDRRLTIQPFVMGVEWDKQSDPTLKRIGASEDLVANIGIGSEVVRNDFDNMPIYREIQREVDMYGNVFVRIPRFYIRKTVTEGLKRIEISTEKLKDFYLPAVFYDFENQKELPYAHIGAYNAGISLDGTRLESKAGVKPLVSRNIVDFRSLARDNGKGYQQLDIHAIDVLQTLFYVEFATLHSRSIHPGYTSGNTESLASGFSDGIVASSGALSMSGTDGFMYRGIENPWGNVYQWTDGVNISDHQAWVCKDAENYASNIFVSPYEKLGYVNHTENGVVKDMGFDPAHPYAEFPVEIGGSSTTGYADYYYQNTGQRLASFGGDWSSGSYAGLSYWGLNYGSGSVFSSFGGRLLRKTT